LGIEDGEISNLKEAELVDIRTPFRDLVGDEVEYTNAGDAVRGQIEALYNITKGAADPDKFSHIISPVMVMEDINSATGDKYESIIEIDYSGLVAKNTGDSGIYTGVFDELLSLLSSNRIRLKLFNSKGIIDAYINHNGITVNTCDGMSEKLTSIRSLLVESVHKIYIQIGIAGANSAGNSDGKVFALVDIADTGETIKSFEANGVNIKIIPHSEDHAIYTPSSYDRETTVSCSKPVVQIDTDNIDSYIETPYDWANVTPKANQWATIFSIVSKSTAVGSDPRTVIGSLKHRLYLKYKEAMCVADLIVYKEADTFKQKISIIRKDALFSQYITDIRFGWCMQDDTSCIVVQALCKDSSVEAESLYVAADYLSNTNVTYDFSSELTIDETYPVYSSTITSAAVEEVTSANIAEYIPDIPVPEQLREYVVTTNGSYTVNQNTKNIPLVEVVDSVSTNNSKLDTILGEFRSRFNLNNTTEIILKKSGSSVQSSIINNESALPYNNLSYNVYSDGTNRIGIIYLELPKAVATNTIYSISFVTDVTSGGKTLKQLEAEGIKFNIIGKDSTSQTKYNNYILASTAGSISNTKIFSIDLSTLIYTVKNTTFDEHTSALQDQITALAARKTAFIASVDLVIPTTGWVADTDTNEVYALCVDMASEIIKEDMIPILTIHPSGDEIARECDMSTAARTIDGALRVYAQKAPAENINCSLTLLAVGGSTGGNGEGGTYVLPTATATRLGGVKIGDGIDANSDGTISVDSNAVAEKVIASPEEVKAMLEEVHKDETVTS